MGPLIGIPPCLDDRGRWKPGRRTQYIDHAYASAVEESGGVPVYLPLQADAAGLVARIDGLLLPGGDDFAPPHPYPPGVRFDPVPEPQLDFDRALLAAALERSRPVLGICYGMQLLALHAGGALHYDLGVDRPAAGAHRLDDPDARHPLRVTPGTRLAELLGARAGAVNSRHHQAVSDPGAACPCATADDGVIEAIELDGAAFALGVQWHPESMERPHRERLFGGLCAAASR